MDRDRTMSTQPDAERGEALAPRPADGEHAFRARKLAVGDDRVAPREEPRTIPWSYGDNRVTAMVVDPDRLFVYWEVTDGAIERARKGLGPGGPGAWLNLRVYDTSGRLFDGTNAHSYFDNRIERSDRQYFFHIGRPGSDAFVEVGLLSHEGYFVKAARSGRVTFPRREPMAWSPPEWMTVRAGTGEVLHRETHGHDGAAAGAGSGRHHGQDGHGDRHAMPGAEGFVPVPLWHIHMSWEELVQSGLASGERVSWEQIFRDGWFEGRRVMTWDGPALITSWEAGPFTYPVEVAGPTTDQFDGPAHRTEIEGRTHIVYGPWQIVIRGLGAHRNRQILQRWEIHQAWVVEEGRGVRVVAMGGREPGAGASERMLVGASEWRWLAASELRLAGASEVHFVGASERRMLGASETWFQAASQWLMRGASERRFLGASEVRLRGASEQVLRGASESLLRGATEQVLRGASERLGASEGRLGGEVPAGSETRLGSAGEGRYPAPPTGRS